MILSAAYRYDKYPVAYLNPVLKLDVDLNRRVRQFVSFHYVEVKAGISGILGLGLVCAVRVDRSSDFNHPRRQGYFNFSFPVRKKRVLYFMLKVVQPHPNPIHRVLIGFKHLRYRAKLTGKPLGSHRRAFMYQRIK